MEKWHMPSNLDKCIVVFAGNGQREYGKAEWLQAKLNCSHTVLTQNWGTSKGLARPRRDFEYPITSNKTEKYKIKSSLFLHWKATFCSSKVNFKKLINHLKNNKNFASSKCKNKSTRNKRGCLWVSQIQHKLVAAGFFCYFYVFSVLSLVFSWSKFWSPHPRLRQD